MKIQLHEKLLLQTVSKSNETNNMIKLNPKSRAFIFTAISFIAILFSCDETEDIKHEILDEQLTQEGNKTQFTQRVVLREDYGSEHELKVLLKGLYNDVFRRISLDDDFDATHIDIEIYNTEKDIQSSLWIATLEKRPNITQPKIDIVKSNIEAIKSQENTAAKKYGFSAEERKNIFNAVLLAEDEAMKEADKKYPLSGKDNVSKNIDFKRRLIKEKKDKILLKYEIEKPVLDSITWEGIKLRWDR